MEGVDPSVPPISMQRTIAKTGFLVSLTSYLCFWLLDALRPGFVARYFSVHLFFLGALVFGVLWVKTDELATDHPRGHVLMAMLAGVVLGALVWISGEGFASLRIVITLLAALIPLMLLRLVKYK